MAKKKKSQRKRNFSYSNTNAQQKPVAKPLASTKTQSDAAIPTELPRVSNPGHQSASTKLDYLRHDVRYIGILAFGFVVLEAVLWLLLQHTGLGTKVFGI